MLGAGTTGQLVQARTDGESRATTSSKMLENCFIFVLKTTGSKIGMLRQSTIYRPEGMATARP